MTPEEMVAALDAAPGYRVLRRAALPAAVGTPPDALKALIVDVETTGLERDDEVVELALLPFWFTPAGGLWYAGEPRSWLRQPSRPMGAEAASVTGLTDADLEGRSIDQVEVAAAAAGAVLAVAHNAAFDRPRCEALLPTGTLPPCWACSANEVPWRAEGLASRGLEHLLYRYGLFHDGHRAAVDCLAVACLLAETLPSGAGVLKTLLDSARRPTFRLAALGSPFEAKDRLKARKYAWDPDRRVWWRDGVAEAELDAELAWLAAEAGCPTPRVDRLTSRERYRL